MSGPYPVYVPTQTTTTTYVPPTLRTAATAPATGPMSVTNISLARPTGSTVVPAATTTAAATTVYDEHLRAKGPRYAPCGSPWMIILWFVIALIVVGLVIWLVNKFLRNKATDAVANAVDGNGNVVVATNGANKVRRTNTPGNAAVVVPAATAATVAAAAAANNNNNNNTLKSPTVNTIQRINNQQLQALLAKGTPVIVMYSWNGCSFCDTARKSLAAIAQDAKIPVVEVERSDVDPNDRPHAYPTVFMAGTDPYSGAPTRIFHKGQDYSPQSFWSFIGDGLQHFLYRL
jgi:hypothetical protein